MADFTPNWFMDFTQQASHDSGCGTSATRSIRVRVKISGASEEIFSPVDEEEDCEKTGLYWSKRGFFRSPPTMDTGKI